MNELETLYLLDPDVIFLNHGSFGATPRPVFTVYQEWQRRLERQPVQFLVDDLPDFFAEARQSLSRYINADRDNVVYVPNATFALNVVARSLDLGPNDEVLTTDHEYGACDNVWRFLSQKRGFTYKQQPVRFPVESNEAIVDQFWQGVTPNTKVIYLSHITSSTAVQLPVEAICQLAKQRDILTIIDGAHAPGQIPIDMEEIGADFYFGNAHKWMCSPKGAGFLFAREEKQHLIDPLVVGWGWGEDRTFTFGSDYLDFLQWLGTNDPATYLAVPAAIEFQKTYIGPSVRQQCHKLVQEGIDEIGNLTGLASCYPDHSFFNQMAVAKLPPLDDLTGFKQRLYRDFRIEIPTIQWNNHQLIRISIQVYNSQDDVNSLIKALGTLLPVFQA